MADKNIQIRHKKDGNWESLFPYTLSENIFNEKGEQEITEARNGEPSLKDRLDEEHEKVTSQLKRTDKKYHAISIDKSEIIAHRGYSALAPENTLPAFQMAIAYGADSLEWDTQISSDGVPVVIHDPTVNRTTNGTGNVKDKTLSQLKSLDAGSSYSSVFEGVRIPTLGEVLELSRNKSKIIYPEIKGYRTQSDITLMVDLIVDYGFEHNCVLQSFNFSDLSYARNLNKNITLGYLCGTTTQFNDALSLAVDDGNGVILCSYQVILDNPSLFSNAKEQGIDVCVYTADSSHDIQNLISIGVTRFMTNKLKGEVVTL